MNSVNVLRLSAKTDKIVIVAKKCIESFTLGYSKPTHVTESRISHYSLLCQFSS